MVQRKKVEQKKVEKKPPTPVDARLLEKFSRIRLRPSLQVYASCQYPAVHVEVSWTSFLADGTLRVVVDGTDDITSALTIDEDARKATGTATVQGVGLHSVEASGEFLASLLPARTVVLHTTSGAYCPY